MNKACFILMLVLVLCVPLLAGCGSDDDKDRYAIVTRPALWEGEKRIGEQVVIYLDQDTGKTWYLTVDKTWKEIKRAD